MKRFEDLHKIYSELRKGPPPTTARPGRFGRIDALLTAPAIYKREKADEKGYNLKILIKEDEHLVKLWDKINKYIEKRDYKDPEKLKGWRTTPIRKTLMDELKNLREFIIKFQVNGFVDKDYVTHHLDEKILSSKEKEDLINFREEFLGEGIHMTEGIRNTGRESFYSRFDKHWPWIKKSGFIVEGKKYFTRVGTLMDYLELLEEVARRKFEEIKTEMRKNISEFLQQKKKEREREGGGKGKKTKRRSAKRRKSKRTKRRSAKRTKRRSAKRTKRRSAKRRTNSKNKRNGRRH